MRRYIRPEYCDYAPRPVATQKLRANNKSNLMARTCSGGLLALSQPKPSSDLDPMYHPSFKGDRLLETRLIHHYTTIVCHLMHNSSLKPLDDLWGIRIPQVASQHELVLDAMLVLSAIHLHSQAVDDNTLQVTISKYLDRTIVSYRQRLPEIDGKMAEPLFLTSVMLAKISWLISHHSCPNESFKLPVQAYYMTRGVQVLYLQRKYLLRKLGYEWLGDEPLQPITREITAEQQCQLNGMEQEIKQLFLHFKVHSMPVLEQSVYQEASRYVLWLYKAYFGAVNTQHLERLIAMMPHRLHSHFFTLLEKNDELAMALLARALVLSLKLNNGAWWLRGSGRYEAIKRDIQGICGLIPAPHNFAMQWPLKVLAGEINL